MVVVMGMTRLSDGFACVFVPPRQLHATVVVEGGGVLRTKINKDRNKFWEIRATYLLLSRAMRGFLS